ncbi:MAG: 2-C-methyl-D-erythritol 4-phosphate cytidylyltransferase [Chloroflexi bacterium]|nr:2-C-methyl-D-erythritol 4-phosphate cytidylyltransferase [Chloroflexota bacterium]
MTKSTGTSLPFLSGRVGAVIVAAGSSRRMGADKMFADLEGAPLLARTVSVFQSSQAIDEIVLVMGAANLGRAKALVGESGWGKVVSVCVGGDLRQESVAHGLAELGTCDWVVIQDGARPMVTDDLIRRGLQAAAETGAAVAAVPSRDTIKMVDESCLVKCTLARSQLWAVQTPQVFRASLIRPAYADIDEEVTDDAMLIERQGYPVKVYFGSYDNIKVTAPEDLELVRLLWRRGRESACG